MLSTGERELRAIDAKIKAVATIAPDLSPAEVTAGVNAYRSSFIDMRAESGAEAAAPMYPGAMAALERLHRQDETLMGVATGKARRGLDHAYASHGIGQYFVTHQTADGHPSKPHPSMSGTAFTELKDNITSYMRNISYIITTNRGMVS